MLIISFSIGVERKDADAMRERLMDYGIEITKQGNYDEKWPMFDEQKPVTYFDCYAPKQRVSMFCDELENSNILTAVLSY